MHRLRLGSLVTLLCAASLTGCGAEFARIDDLPQTRDVSDVDWPRLVDTPAPPTDTLLPETGAAALATLTATRQTVLTRAAQPGPQRVAVAELGGRVARIRQQSATDAPGVDEAELAARAARLTQVRAQPVRGIDASALQARGQRIAAARAQAETNVDAGTLAARARRIKQQSQVYGSAVDQGDLARRAQRVGVAAATPRPETPDLAERRAQTAASRETPPPAPEPRPVRPSPDRSAPVISDDFRKRAEEARRRARERAATTAKTQ